MLAVLKRRLSASLSRALVERLLAQVFLVSRVHEPLSQTAHLKPRYHVSERGRVDYGHQVQAGRKRRGQRSRCGKARRRLSHLEGGLRPTTSGMYLPQNQGGLPVGPDDANGEHPFPRTSNIPNLHGLVIGDRFDSKMLTRRNRVAGGQGKNREHGKDRNG